MGQLISLCKERRKRSGALPNLGLLGLPSSAVSILRTALSAADAEDREELFSAITRGTYRDMLVELTARFGITNHRDTRAVG